MAGYVEAVSGETYQQYMIDHFFKPLGMNDTNWTYTKSMIANEATGAAPSFDIQALLLPLVLEKDKIEDLVREESDGILWFNHIYTDQKGPTGPIGSATNAARFVMAFLNGGMTENANNATIKPDYTGIKIGYAPTYNFNFTIDLDYGSLRDSDDLTITKEIKDSSDKFYQGYYGSSSSTNNITIDSDYGSVTLFKN